MSYVAVDAGGDPCKFSFEICQSMSKRYILDALCKIPLDIGFYCSENSPREAYYYNSGGYCEQFTYLGKY